MRILTLEPGFFKLEAKSKADAIVRPRAAVATLDN